MADMTIREFCELHRACREGREWALANCQTMHDVWDTAKPEWLLWVATMCGVLSERDLRLFAVRCARSVEHLLTDQRSRHAIDVAERFALGNADADELAAACDAARDARLAANAVRAAGVAAAWAADAAVEYAAGFAAWHAAGAAWCAADAAHAAHAAHAARVQHAAWLRELTPCFEREEVAR